MNDNLKEYVKQQYLRAVIEVNPDLFFQLLEKYEFANILLEDIGLDIVKLGCERRAIDEYSSDDIGILKDRKFPLHYITICWKFILNDHKEYHQKEDQIIVFQRKQKNDRIMRYFKEQHGLSMDTIPFKNYWMLYNCNYPDEDWSYFFDDDMSSMISKGYRQKDMELYICVLKGWYDKAKTLLEQGADPSVVFDDKYDSCIEIVKNWRLAYYFICFHPIAFREYDPKEIPLDICNLVGTAAWLQMQALLKQYTM